MSDGRIIIETAIDTKEFDSQMKYIEDKMLDIEDKLKQADMGFEVGDTNKLEAEYERLGNQLIGLKEKQQKYNDAIKQTSKVDLANIKSQLSGIGNSIEGITKKVVRWGLAVFGIRSAFRFIRTSMTELSSRNEQLATDLEYIRFALASTLAPVIEKIVQLAYRLLYYVGYIAKAWFGINIFAGATQKAFEGSNKSLKNSNKEAKKLQKTLTGFDEMNVLQDNKSNDSDTGTGGVGTPSFDLSKLKGDVPDWLKWIADHGKEIIALLAGITAGLIALKFGASGLMALGIGLMVAGLVYAIKGLLDYLKNPTWENFGKIIQGIGIFVIGLGAAFLGLPAVIVGVVVFILGTIIKYWDQIKAFLQKGIDWLVGKSDWIHKTFGDTIGNIYDFFVRTFQRILNWFDLTFKSIKGVFDGIIKFIKGVFTGNWKMAWQGIKQIFSNIWNWIKGTASLILTGLIDKAKTIVSTIGNVIGSVFKAVINAVLTVIENVLNVPINTINTLIGIINKLPKVNLGYLPTFNLPRLAKGGIVNMPGRGVPIGGAIAGEAGREAVLPLQDSQVLQEIADAIGRRITINATITNTMNGRVISRELQKVQNDSNFAFNR